MQSRLRRLGGAIMLLAAVSAVTPARSEASHPCVPQGGTGPTDCVSTTHADSFRNSGDLLAPGSLGRPPIARGASAAAAGSPAKLPTRWCGAERSTDNTRNAVSKGPQVKVVYAYPRGAPDRFAFYKDLIQQDVMAARALVASASGGRRIIRFDMGTDCRGGGTDYVDIQSIALPHDSAYYGYDATFASKLLIADLKPRLRVRGIRNVTTYVDGVMPGSATGVASVPQDDSPGAGNDANRGGQRAFIFGDGSTEFTFNRTRAFMHETLHNLGAVQDGAPHATGLGHCFDREDVMCYDDGGPSAPNPRPEPTCPGWARVDCGANDYFAARPARGSYLARHWNLFDSDFMCAPKACADPNSASIRSALSLAIRSATLRLRRNGLPGLVRDGTVRVRFRSPGAGRLRLVLDAGGRHLARGERSFARPGRGVLRAPLLPAGRRLTHDRRLRIAVRMSFADTSRTLARRSSVLLPRRR